MKENDRVVSDRRRDISSKTILGNPILCAQFLRDNVKIPFLRNVQPEDIEDVSERYRPYLGTEFESDTVKRIRIHPGGEAEQKLKQKVLAESKSNRDGSQIQESVFVISLTEHKSQVDYNVSMQLLKYMVCIWLDYGKEMEGRKEGITGRKSFQYPTVIPIVYYEGKAPWTADRKFRARISHEDLFRDWIPDFTYEVVRLHDYSNEELLARGDEISLIMLFNKIQDTVDISEFLKLPREKLNDMIRDTPEVILDIIVSVMESLCIKIGATEEETRECVDRVRERRMGYLFENMEKMNIQEERRNTAEARAEAEKARAELEEARKEARKEIEEIRKATVEALITTCKEFGADKEQTTEKIINKCGMDPQTAREKVELYWEDI